MNVRIFLLQEYCQQAYFVSLLVLILREKVISARMAQKDDRDDRISQLEKEVVRLQVQRMAQKDNRDDRISQLEKEVVRLKVQRMTRKRNSDVPIQTTSREEPITLPVSDMTID